MTGVELARRAVACPGWRWMPGMRYQIVNERGQIGGWMRASDRVSHLDALYPVAGESEVALPDLDDPERTSFELVTDIFLGGSSKQSEAQFMRAVTSSWGVQNDEEQLGWGLLA